MKSLTDEQREQWLSQWDADTQEKFKANPFVEWLLQCTCANIMKGLRGEMQPPPPSKKPKPKVSRCKECQKPTDKCECGGEDDDMPGFGLFDDDSPCESSDDDYPNGHEMR